MKIMNKKQQGQLEKFKKFTAWMHGDCKRAEILAGAQFLSALGLFNYIEVLGAFLIGYFEKDDKGQILKNPKTGENKKTRSEYRFNAFFSYLSQEYEGLLNKHSEIYNELRCGLTHEFLPKKRKFSVIKIILNCNEKDKEKIIDKIDNTINFDIKNPIDDSIVDCGIIFLHHDREEIWQIFTLKLAVDLGEGIKKLINEIEQGKNKKLMENFFETADQINIQNF